VKQKLGHKEINKQRCGLSRKRHGNAVNVNWKTSLFYQ